MEDEEFYLQVENELKESFKDEALWSKAKYLAKDDEKETKIQYTKLRVTQLKKESAKDSMKPFVKTFMKGFAWIRNNKLKAFLWYLVIFWIIAAITSP